MASLCGGSRQRSTPRLVVKGGVSSKSLRMGAGGGLTIEPARTGGGENPPDKMIPSQSRTRRGVARCACGAPLDGFDGFDGGPWPRAIPPPRWRCRRRSAATRVRRASGDRGRRPSDRVCRFYFVARCAGRSETVNCRAGRVVSSSRIVTHGHGPRPTRQAPRPAGSPAGRL